MATTSIYLSVRRVHRGHQSPSGPEGSTGHASSHQRTFDASVAVGCPDLPLFERHRTDIQAAPWSANIPAMDWILIGVGATLTIIGLVMIPLPGPGFLVLFAGAAVLAAGVAIRFSKRVSQG